MSVTPGLPQQAATAGAAHPGKLIKCDVAYPVPITPFISRQREPRMLPRAIDHAITASADEACMVALELTTATAAHLTCPASQGAATRCAVVMSSARISSKFEVRLHRGRI